MLPPLHLAGMQPLPESYEAVVRGFVARGDVNTAEEVWASNRRSGVDCSRSWVVVTAAMFRCGLRGAALQPHACTPEGAGRGRA